MTAALPGQRVAADPLALWAEAPPVGDEEDRRARVALSVLTEPGRWDVHDAVERFGAVAVADALRRGARVGRVTAQVAAGAARRAGSAQPQRHLDLLQARGGRVLCPGDREWPGEPLAWQPGVMEFAPPLALQVRGPHDLLRACATAAAVVGARRASAYGRHVAFALGHGLAERGCAVVSGLAHGIDAAAHRGALVAAQRPDAGPTVAVLACGVDEPYPADHARLLEEVAEHGLVVSEVVCGTRPTRARFLVRNRLIAALSQGTVVVEATARSGTRSTAGRADDLSRVVMAVPGPVTSDASEYPHALLRDGAAQLVTSAEQVLESVGRIGAALAPSKQVPRVPRDDLDRDARAVLDALPVGGPGLGEAVLADRAGVAPGVVRRVLPPLQLVGLVERGAQGWRLSALGAAR